MAKRKSAPRKTSSASRPKAVPPQSTAPGRDLVMVTTGTAALRAAPGVLASASGASVEPLARLLRQHGASLQPLFGNEDRMLRMMAAAPAAMPADVPDLTRYYHVDAPDDQLDALAAALLEQDTVDGAYVTPRSAPPVVRAVPSARRDEAPPATPNFIARQTYLDAAPAGIDARHSWTRSGGRGQGVRIIDIEGAWRFSHEDMLLNQGGVIGGTNSTEISWRNHGTAVAGVIGADENSLGVTGICPEANIRAISIFGNGQSSAKAITDAANALSPGDIILIELHRPGPRLAFAERDDQLGYIAVEFWPADLAAIVFATSVRGVIVVEAAGNGAENLDDALYNTRPTGFPTTWRNPFNLGSPQSGAILVGAGAPPPGTHGRDHGPDRSRLGFSNFGARVDVQGWGEEVTTCGYGDLQGGSNEDLWYTDSFNGTSSSSPVVVGAVSCLQGVLRARSKPLLTPATARNVLRATGSPQQDAPGRPATQRIGNRPDLFAAFQHLGLGKGFLKETKDKEKIEVKELKDKEKGEKEQAKDLKESKEFDKQKDKNEKEVSKDAKDFVKEFDKTKEKNEKEIIKELEKGKEVKDKNKELEKIQKESDTAQFGGELGDRVRQLEDTVASLVHFINAADRPDLQHSALGGETDLRTRLEKQAVDAKTQKDTKDVEKGRES